MTSRFLLSRPGSLLLLLAGALNALAFAPEPFPAGFLPYLQLGCLTFLAYSIWYQPTTGRALRGAFLYGVGYFATGLYWIYISLHNYGGLMAPLAAAAVLCLAAAMALYFVLVAALSRALAPYPGRGQLRLFDTFYLAAVWASAWTLGEWLRGTLFTGLPWLNSSYAHVDGMLSGWAPIVGVYGIGWLASFLAAALALTLLAHKTPNDRPAVLLVLIAAALTVGGLGLRQINWSQPTGAPLIVRLTQGNIPQSEKFDPQLLQQGLDTYMQLAALPPKNPGAEPAIIVLPETIMVLFQHSYPDEIWQQWLDIAQMQQATLLMGAPISSTAPATAAPTLAEPASRYTNSAILLNGTTPLSAILDGTADGRYDKHHLLPFGEFIPTGFRWFVDALNIPLGDFDRGAQRQPLFTINNQTLAPNICYEDVFGEEIIRAVRPDPQLGPGATMLVNISNLGWFGNSLALGQHLQISRMRAIETARPMLRATNTGMTAAIAPDGQVRAALPPHITGVLDVEVQGTTGLTPYVRWGNRPVIIWAILFLLAALGRRLQAKKQLQPE